MLSNDFYPLQTTEIVSKRDFGYGADLEGMIFAYNHRMQPACVILTIRVVPSRSILQLDQVCFVRLEKGCSILNPVLNSVTEVGKKQKNCTKYLTVRYPATRASFNLRSMGRKKERFYGAVDE